MGICLTPSFLVAEVFVLFSAALHHLEQEQTYSPIKVTKIQVTVFKGITLIRTINYFYNLFGLGQ